HDVLEFEVVPVVGEVGLQAGADREHGEDHPPRDPVGDEGSLRDDRDEEEERKGGCEEIDEVQGLGPDRDHPVHHDEGPEGAEAVTFGHVSTSSSGRASWSIDFPTISRKMSSRLTGPIETRTPRSRAFMASSRAAPSLAKTRWPPSMSATRPYESSSSRGNGSCTVTR